jgi:hypothetical protein
VLRLGFGAAVTALALTGASASIVYNVDQAIGIGSVTGSLTTDGTIGALAAADFTDWNLTLSIPSAGETFVLTTANSVVLEQGSDVTATATAISFNFSGADNGFLLFQDGLFSGQHYWCNATAFDTCFQGKSVVPVFVGTAFGNVAASGDLAIATTGVPEPSTWAMLIAGFVGLGLAGYRVSRMDVGSA